MNAASQSNIQKGKLSFLCAADLTEKNGHLVKLSYSGSDPVVALPAAITDITPYLVVNGKEADLMSDVEPLNPGQNHRIVAKGTGSAGAQLVLADPSTAADAGKVRKIPTDAGTYRVIGIAEENFVDGQLVLVRPVPVGNIVVSG